MEKWFIWDEIYGEVFIDIIGEVFIDIIGTAAAADGPLKYAFKVWNELTESDRKRRLKFDLCTGYFDEDDNLDFDTIDVIYSIK